MASSAVPTSSAKSEDPTPVRKARWEPVNLLLPLFVLTLTFCFYSSTQQFEFVWDDHPQIVENRSVQSWRYVPRYFTSHVWASVYPQGNYYRPLFLLWLRVNHALFGLQPRGWHLASVMAHLLVTLWVYCLALRLTKDRGAAVFAGIIFGLHPVHVESVAWVSGVTDPLMCLFLLPSFLYYLDFRERIGNGRRRLALSLLLYALALLAKETAVVFPLIVFAHAWIDDVEPQAVAGAGSWVKRVGRCLFQVVPYLTLSAAYLAVRMVVLRDYSSVINPMSPLTMAQTWPSLLLFYLKLLVWPFGLSVFYDTPYVLDPGLSNFLLPAAGVLAVAAGLYVASSSRVWGKAVLIAALWLVVPVFPVLNLVALPEGEFAHDRYLYLSCLGFALLLAMALRQLSFGQARLLGHPAVQVVSVAALAGVFGIGMLTQTAYWANDLLLYSRGASVAPINPNARINLATQAGKMGFYQAARKLYEEVLLQSPNSSLVYYDLGYTYYKLGNLREADHWLSLSVATNDAVGPDKFLYLGLTKYRLGRVRDAVALIQHAIELQPDAPGYHFALGVLYKTGGDLDRALVEFRAELVNDPEQNAARKQIGEILSGHSNPGSGPLSGHGPGFLPAPQKR